MSDQPTGSATADMYLTVQSARAGTVKGEANAADHVDEIVVCGWHWGMAANTDAASRGGGQGGTPSRRSLRPLVIDKRLDRATTSLMSVLVNNDKIKSAVLTMRVAGAGQQQDFTTITLTDGYLIEIECAADETGHVRERLTFSYAHASVEYRVQPVGGGQVGATNSFDVDA